MSKPRDIRERAFDFACFTVRVCEQLGGRRWCIRRLSRQLLDSSTAIGANLEEAQAGQSKPDFIAKTFVALKEARETRFWLRLIAACDPPVREHVIPLLGEVDELIAILMAIVKRARSSPLRGQ